MNLVDGEQVFLWCVDRRDGSVTWKRPVGSSEGHAHRKHNMATPSPVVGDGRVFVMTGNGALKGFTLEGKELWARDLQADYGPFGPGDDGDDGGQGEGERGYGGGSSGERSGEALDAAYAERRMRWEPVYEVTQMKGDGEAHPSLSPNDETS